MFLIKTIIWLVVWNIFSIIYVMSSFPVAYIFQDSQNHQADSFFKVPSGKRLHNYGKSMNISIFHL